MIHAKTWMTPENNMLNEKKQVLHILYDFIYMQCLKQANP